MFRYIRNFFAYIIFRLLNLFFSVKSCNGNSLLLINAGMLGDVVISSLVLEYDRQINEYDNIYFLVREEFSFILEGYKGKANVIKWKSQEYKRNVIARYKFLNYLQSLNLKTTYNLTSARGITCDEISLLSGAKEIFCINSNWLYLKNKYGKIFNNLYNKVLYEDVFNEYDKHLKLIEELTNIKANIFINGDSRVFGKTNLSSKKDILLENKKYVVLSPFAADYKRSYGVDNYRKLCREISKKYPVVVLGTDFERELGNSIISGISNAINYAGKFSLSEIPAIIKNALFYVGNDSGLTHLALRLNIPLVAIIGGGNYGRYLPYLESAKRKYLFHQMDCFGCQWNCIYKERLCITNIDLCKVIDSIEKINNENS